MAVVLQTSTDKAEQRYV